jgi:hypothetical protein
MFPQREKAPDSEGEHYPFGHHQHCGNGPGEEAEECNGEVRDANRLGDLAREEPQHDDRGCARHDRDGDAGLNW